MQIAEEFVDMLPGPLAVLDGIGLVLQLVLVEEFAYEHADFADTSEG
jgi:hypothetical protein